MKISTFSTFKKEQFPRKLYAEIQYLNKFERKLDLTVHKIYYFTLFQGDVAVVQCPSGSTGFAKWNCDHPDALRTYENQVGWSTKGKLFYYNLFF